MKTLTVSELANYLKLHEYTVRRLAKKGKIPGFKAGGQWRFDVKEIEEWKRNQGQEKPVEGR